MNPINSSQVALTTLATVLIIPLLNRRTGLLAVYTASKPTKPFTIPTL